MHLFIFGNSSSLSQAELSVFFPKHSFISSDVAKVDGDLDVTQWIGRLGGTVKIAKVIAVLANITTNDIARELVDIRTGFPPGGRSDNKLRLSFGISSYSRDFRVQIPFLRQVKDELTAREISSRFVVPKEGNTLSSVVVSKQELVELIVVGKEGEWLVGQTVAVQDFEEWNRRDYGRPEVDPKAGMLPPKVARMAVNLAYSETRNSKLETRILLDPFCGMGTILGEALLSGWQVIGSDQSPEVVEKAKKNLEWLTTPDSRYQSSPIPGIVGSWKLFVSDATHVSEKLPPESIDAIVTEPFLGSTQIGDKQEKIKNVIKGLEKLYIGCFKDWHKVLKPGGRVVIALPEYAVGGRTYFVKSVIDRCETLGYTLLAGPIAYNRPQAIVRRKFYLLKKISE